LLGSSGGADSDPSRPPCGGTGFNGGKAISLRTFTSKISIIKLLIDAYRYRAYTNALGTVLLTLSITFLLHKNLSGDLVQRMMLGFEQVGKSRDAAALPVSYQHYIDVLVRTTSNSPARAVDEYL
jgi:hypothetical protein